MDKLVIINRALGETGNNRLNMLADPDYPDEWDHANQAFERRLDDLISRHSWPFAQKRAALVLSETDATRGRLQYGFALPPDCLHLRQILYTDGCPLRGDLWQLEGVDSVSGMIWSYYSSGLTALYNFEPLNVVWHPQAAEILTIFIEASLCRSLNEDTPEAAVRENRAEARLAEGRSHIAQQSPARNVYQSSTQRARRTRKA